MQRLARFSFRRRRLVLAAWLSVLVVLGALVAGVGAAYDDQFSLPSTESTEALRVLQRVSPQAAGDQLTAVVHVDEGSVTDAAAKARFTAALGAAEATDAVVAVTSPYSPAGSG